MRLAAGEDFCIHGGIHEFDRGMMRMLFIVTIRFERS
jgi:hypothetical protein